MHKASNMKKFASFRYPILLMGLILIACQSTAQEALTVFLVRHAEKVDHSKDPDLSPEGYLRAEALAYILSDAEIEGVHSTNYIRTRETASPVADYFKLETELYNPMDLPALARKLKSQGGRHLVVGHSNTTPAMVEFLGGEAGPPVADEWEYDRLYILTITQEGVQTLRLRYGKPSSSLPSKIKASSLLVPQTTGSALKSLQTLGLSARP